MKRTSAAVTMGLMGLVLAASFSIRHQSFISGLGGLLGGSLLVGAYLLLNWPQWQAGDRRVRRITSLLVGLTFTLLLLNLLAQRLG